MTERPEPTEYDLYYARYIDLVPEGEIVMTLQSQVEKTLALLNSVPESKAGYAYDTGKWSIAEVMGHVIDAERIFTYRALRIGRNDKTPLPGFEQDDYIANTDFKKRTIGSLKEEWTVVRQASLQLFSHFTDEEWMRRGIASGKPISTRALAYIVSGHELHHVNVLKTRYF
jgi:hypothetical protein